MTFPGLNSRAAAAAVAPATIDFDELPLGNNSYKNGSDGSGGFLTRDTFFTNSYQPDYQAWMGWALSNVTNTAANGYSNQYAAYPGSGADGSRNFAVGFLGAHSYAPEGESEIHNGLIHLPPGLEPTQVEIANSTYTVKSMLQGDAFAKKFGGPSGNDPDWLRLTIIGVNEDQIPLVSTTLMLADYRGDQSGDYIRDGWTNVDLSGFRGKGVRGLTFALDSTDVGLYGMNTPAYFALDNLELSPIDSTTTPRGDLNEDGNINRADLALLLHHLGTTSSATIAMGDLNDDGGVGLADVMALRSLMQEAAATVGSPSAVPEPSTFLLAGFGALGLIAARFKGRSARVDAPRP
jgi:hypothetical protein